MAERGASRATRLATIALLVVIAVQSGAAAVRDSVTVDEVAHVAVGIAMWRAGNLALDPINPPLPRLLLALPPLAMNAKLEPRPELDEWKLGLALMAEDTARYHEIHVAARIVTIALSLVLAIVVAEVASHLFGRSAGVLALALYAFSPTLLAHGHLATVDLIAALTYFGIVAAGAAVLERRSLGGVVVLGAVFGLAIACKFSSGVAVLLVVGVLLLAKGETPRKLGSRFGSVAAQLAIAGFVALIVLCASYGFQAMAVPLGEIRFRPDGTFARLAADWPSARLPLPAGFLQGIDWLATPNRAGERTFYFAGETSSTPWRSYHLVAFALKTPLAFLLIAIPALVSALFSRGESRSVRFVGISVVLVFAANALLNPLNLGVRHVMPAEPLLCVLAAGLVMRRLGPSIAIGLVGLEAVAALSVAPQYLASFNLLARGPEHGHEWLVDSNLDWGQDLNRLREYMTEHEIDSVALAYFGTVHPATYGIRFTPLTRDATGIVVISPTLLVGVPSTMWRATEQWARSAPDEYAWVRERRPIARVGALFVYELGQEQPLGEPTKPPTSES